VVRLTSYRCYLKIKGDKLSILKPREVYKPFEYDKAAEYWEKQQNAHWLPSEVSLANDIKNWKEDLVDSEREVYGQVLKSFTQLELVVGNDYWRHLGGLFRKPEIQMMCAAFSNMECFDKDSELLTSEGWVNVADVTMSHKIAQYSLDTSIVEFVNPKKVVNYDYKGKMHFYNSKSSSICVTPNHDMIYKRHASEVYGKTKSQSVSLGRNYKYPVTGYSEVEGNRLSNLNKLLIAIQADGNLRSLCDSVNENYRLCTVKLKKQRKKKRLSSILDCCDIDFVVNTLEDFSIYSFKVPEEVSLSSIKNLGFLKLSELSSLEACDIIEECLHWDGSANTYYNTNEEAVDKLQAIATISGHYRANKGVNRTKESAMKVKLPRGGTPYSTKTCYALGFTETTSTTYPKKQEVDYDDKVYCVSVDSENLISRRCGKVAFTGNTVHVQAYRYLNDSLGLDDYAAFLQDTTAVAKLDKLKNTKGKTKRDIARRLAIFSGFTEGVSLFSSFAILISLSRYNLMTGMKNIIEWSALDEDLHSKGGIWLFNTLIEENPDIWDDELKGEIYEAARLAVQLEDDFIDKAFSLGTIRGLDHKDVKNYIRNRANEKLVAMKLKINWKNIDQESLKKMDWFEEMVFGQNSTDFFHARVSEYSKSTLSVDSLFKGYDNE